MQACSSKGFVLLAAVFLGLLVFNSAASAQGKGGLLLFSTKGSQKAQEKSAKALPEIPENLDQAEINEIVAGLGDDQVRRLLIQELGKSASSAAGKDEDKKVTGIAAVVQNVEENVTLFHQRLRDLQSGVAAVREFLPQAYAGLRGEGGTSNIILMFVAVAVFSSLEVLAPIGCSGAMPPA